MNAKPIKTRLLMVGLLLGLGLALVAGRLYQVQVSQAKQCRVERCCRPPTGLARHKSKLATFSQIAGVRLVDPGIIQRKSWTNTCPG